MAERRGFHRMLEASWAYRLSQDLISRSDTTVRLRQELYPELGTRPVRVLDIGCGPAAFWSRYHDVPSLSYVGLEPNAAYVNAARRRFPEIEMHLGTAADMGDAIAEEFDLIVLEGVMHHIDDGTAVETLAFASEHLADGGRLVALDPVLIEGQHPIARALARFDRGQHVRTLAGYRALAEGVFDEPSISARRLTGLLRVPYDHCVLTVTRD